MSQTEYFFESYGIAGVILKIARFVFIEESDFWNLAFGDYNVIESTVNDGVRSNNGDRDRILATVVAVTAGFFWHHPDATVYFEGSTLSETRLYKLAAISKQDLFPEKTAIARAIALKIKSRPARQGKRVALPAAGLFHTHHYRS